MQQAWSMLKMSCTAHGALYCSSTYLQVDGVVDRSILHQHNLAIPGCNSHPMLNIEQACNRMLGQTVDASRLFAELRKPPHLLPNMSDYPMLEKSAESCLMRLL